MLHNIQLSPDWKLINALSEIDRFGGAWSSIEKREGQSLRQLKSIATVCSVGASTRIEGSKMTDDEVMVLLDNLKVSKLEERDAQEVAGYFHALDTIVESYRDIEINENTVKSLHNLLLKYSKKDEWHKGNYKQHSNAVEATNPNGTKHTMFQTTAPGFETEGAMRGLIEWYNSDKETHSIVRSAIFVYDFLSIHPFQDGNGRLSRLLGTLLLMKHGYSWIQYVSFEHEIENRKADYYGVLMQCQKKRPGEDVYPWVIFFLDCLSQIQQNLLSKLEVKGSLAQMDTREKKIYVFIENHPGYKSGQIAEKLNIPLPTVKRVLSDMVMQKLLSKHSTGAGTNYTVEKTASTRKDLIFILNSKEKSKEFTFMNSHESIEIKKIILTPLFEWTRPEEWANKLMNRGLLLKVSGTSSKGATSALAPISIAALTAPTNFQPIFSLSNRTSIPINLWQKRLSMGEYPVKVTVEILSADSNLLFDVLIVYDEVKVD